MEEETIVVSSLTSKKTKKSFYVKDNLCSLMFISTASSNFLKNFWAGYDATVLKILYKNGYELLGKTVLDELSCGGTGLLANTGPVYNPYDKSRIIGGSSSGSAWVVANKLSTFSIGTDTGGSVVVPASYCGLFGFKPAYGSISRLGLMPVCSFLDTIGIIADRVENIKKIYSLISCPDSLDLWTTIENEKEIKALTVIKIVSVIQDIENFLSNEYKKIYKNIIYKLKLTGVYSIKKINIPNYIKNNLFFGWISICFTELVSNLNSLRGVTFGDKQNISSVTKRTSLLGSIVKKRLLIGSWIISNQKENLQKIYIWRALLNKWINNLFNECSLFIFPTTIKEAPLITQNEKFLSLGTDESWINNLHFINNLSRIPSLTTPIGIINKIPIGMSINAQKGDEDEIFKLSHNISYSV